MAKKVDAWYDRKWLLPTLAVLTFVSMPFREDIREVVKGLGVVLDDWLFDSLLAGGLIGLVVLLLLKSDRAARACGDLRGQVQGDLAAHRNQLKGDLADHGRQLKTDLGVLVDSQLSPISDRIGTLQSTVSAFGGRLEAVDSRLAALDARLATLDSRLAALDSRVTALKDAVARSTDPT